MVERASARMDLLLEAIVNLGRGLEVESLLHRIVTTAADLVDARYGALGVLGDDGQIARFLTVGLSEEQIRRIGPYPTGHGVLGELIRHPVPLRLDDLTTHPASIGVPPGHPPMHSFVGVPLRVHGAAFGNLYLTEKRGGRFFDAEDERTLEGLAVAASVAVENARLYDEARLRERWAHGNDEISRRVLAGASPEEVLDLVGAEAMRVAAADLATIAVPEPGTGRLVVQSACGLGAQNLRGTTLPASGTFAAKTFVSGMPMVTADAVADDRAGLSVAFPDDLGPLVAMPLGEQDRTRGVLIVARRRGGAPFAPVVVEALNAFAAQAALALELAERRADAEHLAVLRDRERIARDLHDLAIQHLYATGLSLQALGRKVGGDTGERLAAAVDEVDETISLIRTTVHRLQPGTGARQVGLRSRVITEVDRAARSLGFTPHLRFEGTVETSIPADLADHVVAVLRESLSNVMRHAGATRVDVVLAVSDDVALTVVDDGTGLPAHVEHRGGLANLGDRAAELGGSLDVVPARADGGPGSGRGTDRSVRPGTRLTWRVPLPEA